MTKLDRRIQAAERVAATLAQQTERGLSGPPLYRAIEAAMGWPAGCLPDDAKAARAMGFECVQAAVADRLGLTLGEWRAILQELARGHDAGL